MSTEIKYTILKNDKDINKATLRKYGLHADVTLIDIATDIRGFGKLKSEMQSNVALRKALSINITKNFPKIASLSDKELFAAQELFKAKQEIKAYEEDLKTIKKNLKTFADEMVILKKQIGITDETEADRALEEVGKIKDVAGATLKRELKKHGKEG